VNETRALTVQQQQLSLSTWQVIQAIAPTMHEARLFGVSSPQQAAAIMIKGAELGLSLSASFEFVQVVQGKPTLSPRGALALILNSGLLDGLNIQDKSDACTVTMKRKGGLEYTLTYSMDDARKAGLIKPGSAWESYGPNMMRWRAIGFTADVLFSDVCGGMKRADEFGAAIDTQGNVIEGEWTAAPAVSQSAQPAPAAAPAAPAITLDDLVNQFGAEAVMENNFGKIPGTLEEVAEVARRLGANGNG
jgi:hypothetical protein